MIKKIEYWILKYISLAVLGISFISISQCSCGHMYQIEMDNSLKTKIREKAKVTRNIVKD